MRYAYIKNGDAVEQVRRVVQGGEDRSGPDAFVGDFIRAHPQDQILVLCRWTKQDRFASGNVSAESRPAGGSGVRRLLGRVTSALGIARAIWRWKPDRILCGCVAELLWVSVAMAKILRVPIVCSRHSGLLDRSGVGGLFGTLDRSSIRSCVGAACHGPFLAEQVRELGVPAHRVFEFEADVRTFAERAASTPMPEKYRQLTDSSKRTILYVGRIQADKGALDLLEACAPLFAKYPGSLRLVYFGAGRDADRLTREIATRGLSEHVSFGGKVGHAELPSIMKAATTVVAPTRPELIEGRCMVVLESLALGVPVVAPDFAAFPYAIRHDVNGLLYEPGSVPALRQSLESLLADPARLARLRQGAAASSKELLQEPPGFAGAVEAAFT